MHQAHFTEVGQYQVHAVGHDAEYRDHDQCAVDERRYAEQWRQGEAGNGQNEQGKFARVHRAVAPEASPPGRITKKIVSTANAAAVV